MKKNLENVLREYRESIGLTQSEVGKLVGKNCRTISAYELGIRKPPLNVAIKLCKIYKAKFENVFAKYY